MKSQPIQVSVQLFDALIKVPIEMALKIIHQRLMCLQTIRRAIGFRCPQKFWASGNNLNNGRTEIAGDNLFKPNDVLFTPVPANALNGTSAYVYIRDEDANHTSGYKVMQASKYSNDGWFDGGVAATKTAKQLY